MVALAIGDNSLLELSRLDVDRPPPSYTVDLLKLLHAADRELFFLVGADILPELPRWRQPEEILRLARLAVVQRPGFPQPDLAALPAAARERVDVVPIPGVDIAARELRERVRASQPIRYLTPPLVEQYISEHGLYMVKTV
jgi:nicotinate-nucleotide adenylyltransferase